jgi:hypothetical protein
VIDNHYDRLTTGSGSSPAPSAPTRWVEAGVEGVRYDANRLSVTRGVVPRFTRLRPASRRVVSFPAEPPAGVALAQASDGNDDFPPGVSFSEIRESVGSLA